MLWDNVNTSAGDASQIDDSTKPCTQGNPADSADYKTLTVEATREAFAQVNEFVDSFLEAHDCPLKAQMQIDLCVEEVFVNIASYAYGDTTGTAQIDLCGKNGEVTLVFSDEGQPYDPLAKDDPDITLDAQSRQIGGLGIFLVKKNMDEVRYRYENGKNILTLHKTWNS